MNPIELAQSVTLSEELLRIQNSIKEKGYALTSDKALGLPADMHQYINSTFYTDDLLGPEVPGLPPHDRLRVRDVIEYKRRSGILLLNEYPIITMRPVADVVVPREYNRTYTLESSQLVTWISNVLSMIPPEDQYDHGTMEINFVRTFQHITACKHQDNEHFVGVYVTARECQGAITSLYPLESPDDALLDVVLQPGEYIFFRDADFFHNTTPLEPRFEGDQPHRDAVVVCVSYAGTYLKATWLP